MQNRSRVSTKRSSLSPVGTSAIANSINESEPILLLEGGRGYDLQIILETDEGSASVNGTFWLDEYDQDRNMDVMGLNVYLFIILVTIVIVILVLFLARKYT